MQIEKAPANQENISLTAGATNAHNTTKHRNVLRHVSLVVL